MNVFRASMMIRLACIALVGVAAAAPVAHAGGGRIQFSGAVVEPTCAVQTALPALLVQGERHTCRASARSPGRNYARHVVELTASDTLGDPLLAYYLGNTPAGDAARVVVQTYD